MNDSVIKQKRKEKKLTLNGLAKIIGVSPATIKRWQNKTFSPDCKQVILLSKVLNVGITTIVNDYKEEK